MRAGFLTKLLTRRRQRPLLVSARAAFTRYQHHPTTTNNDSHNHSMRPGYLWTASTAAILATPWATSAFSTCRISRHHQQRPLQQRIEQASIRCFAANSKSRSKKNKKLSSKSSSAGVEGEDDDDEEEEDEATVMFQPIQDPASLPFASTYHAPVMWNECIDALLSCQRAQDRQPTSAAKKNNLVFVDGTLGGGGHSEALLQALQPGDVVFGCDVDPAALKTASQRLEQYLQPSDDLPLFVPVQSNFAQLSTRLPQQVYPTGDSSTSDPSQPQRRILEGLNSVDGILLDLGVSSHQIDTPERGFAFMKDGPLDMRMMGGTITGTSSSSHSAQPESSLTAADLCNELEENELARIFQQYGDEPRNRARTIAQSIVLHRPLTTTGQLQQAVAAVVPAFHKQSKRKGLTATLARVFQSLRIVVNQEDRVLKQVLEDVCPDLLREGGRLVVLSYHSMEDRATKRIMRDGTIAKQRGSPERDMYGNFIGPAKPFQPLGKFQKATDEEIAMNSRARSATLRIAERLKVVTDEEEEEGDDGYDRL